MARMTKCSRKSSANGWWLEYAVGRSTIDRQTDLIKWTESLGKFEDYGPSNTFMKKLKYVLEHEPVEKWKYAHACRLLRMCSEKLKIIWLHQFVVLIDRIWKPIRI